MGDEVGGNTDDVFFRSNILLLPHLVLSLIPLFLQVCFSRLPYMHGFKCLSFQQAFLKSKFYIVYLQRLSQGTQTVTLVCDKWCI